MASEAELKAAGEKYIPKDYDPALYKLRHSLAHVLAQAVVEKFPQAKPTIGPPIEYGFYYDFDLDVNPSDGEAAFYGPKIDVQVARLPLVLGDEALQNAADGRALRQQHREAGTEDRFVSE